MQLSGDNPDIDKFVDLARILELQARDNPSLLLEAAREWVKAGDLVRAELALLQAVEAGVSGARSRYVTLLTSERSPNNAYDYYFLAATKAPKIYLELAAFAYRRGDDAVVTDAYRRAVDADVAEATLLYAEWLGLTGDFGRKVELLESAVRDGHQEHLVELGRTYSRIGDFLSAEACFSTAAAAGDESAYAPWAKSLLDRDLDIQAIDLWKRAAEQTGNFDYLDEAAQIQAGIDQVEAERTLRYGVRMGSAVCMADLAETLAAKGDLAGALKQLESALEKGAQVHVPIGRLHLQLNNPELAELNFESGLATGEPNAASELIELLRERGETPNIPGILDRAVAGGNPVAELHKARHYRKAADTIAADLTYSSYLNRDRGWESYREYAEFFVEQGNSEGAFRILDLGVERGYAECQVLKADMLARRGEDLQATEEYRVAMQMHAPKAHEAYGNFLYSRGKRKEAAEVFRSGARLGNGQSWMKAARAFARVQDVANANEAFTQARVIRAPGATKAHVYFLRSIGRADQAEQVLLEDVTSQPQLWVELARLRNAIGDVDGARDAYRNAVAHDPAVGAEHGKFLLENGLLTAPSSSRSPTAELSL